jgi:hypothetical protein
MTDDDEEWGKVPSWQFGYNPHRSTLLEGGVGYSVLSQTAVCTNRKKRRKEKYKKMKEWTK